MSAGGPHNTGANEAHPNVARGLPGQDRVGTSRYLHRCPSAVKARGADQIILGHVPGGHYSYETPLLRCPWVHGRPFAMSRSDPTKVLPLIRGRTRRGRCRKKWRMNNNKEVVPFHRLCVPFLLVWPSARPSRIVHPIPPFFRAGPLSHLLQTLDLTKCVCSNM